ncbi:quinolinate synthase NadA [Bacillus marinisedimentorum]|uniref:quinolinate synthase NadA n=1 Tax=Bacillus marinisedimentorum TaxID=1821260 RepID=UPI000871C7B5|nr:quinolinate synthase NadA [Bacillus marinisedimentorum]
MDILELMDKNGKAKIPNDYYNMERTELEEKIRNAKFELGDKLFIPGHHYQKDEVIQFADARGDSLELARLAENNDRAEFIVFCGVHFMAETADILTGASQQVILPDMRAGCSMADMADIHQTERAWEMLSRKFGDTILPLTYVNSTAAIKAFVGKHGGATVTSSNAEKMVKWAFDQKERILFLPDQHLGRNTAYSLGIPLEQMAVWDPVTGTLETEGNPDEVKVILWKGHCSVHETFTTENVQKIRVQERDRRIIVHPECTFEVVQAADENGSTKKIIETVTAAVPGSKWAIGTEMNLVNRLIKENPDKDIISLNPYMCACLTMNRIDLQHLAWSLDNILENKITNKISVAQQTAEDARLALERMLKLA